MIRLAYLFLLPLVLMVGACSTHVPLRDPLPPVTPGSAPSATYRLEPGDLLQVGVWKEPDLQAEVLVRPDGGISFALAGDLKAAGRTVDEVRMELADRIKHFIPDAAVTVSLKGTAGNKVYVVGKVNRPGEYALNRPIDVLQALSLAGGPTVFADVDNIQLVRKSGDRTITARFNYTQVSRGKYLEQDLQLRGGDTIIVP
jgi:polysaccharide export outer membrane protein